MLPKLTILTLAFVAFVAVFASAADMEMDKVEDSTVSPIADMAIIDAEMKTSTERPPVMEAAKQDEKPASQRHTVADFIIHPLIAFKPRNPEEDGTAAAAAAGKQANGASSTTTPSPWQLFGFNAGQGLGSQVTNLAGQVSGWLNDRIQFPGLVETPVRESTTTSTSTTTTPRPDVVVRVQHKASTRAPLISINNRNRPNRPQFESEENDDDEEDEDDNDEDNNNSGEATDDNESSNENGSNSSNENGSESSNENGSEEEDTDQNKDEDEHVDDEDEEDTSQRPNNRRRPLRNNGNRNRNGQRRRVRPQQQNNRRLAQPNNRPQRRRPAAANEVSNDDEQYDDEYADNDNFYYGARPSTKRSQSNPNFIQRGQQQLINQIRQLTRGQSPAEIGTAIRKAQRGNGANNRRRPQAATLFVNRNGQTIYVAPELQQMSAAPQYQQVYAQPIMQKPVMGNAYPQPPLTVPLKRKGQPTQYITIPWAQLGISPPNNIVSITEGIQSQPLILNIPQSAINAMQNQAMSSRPKKKRPQLITADAVPLLADASLMEIFKPPQIPPSRTSISSKPLTATNVTPVIVAKPSSTKTSSSLLQQRIRPGTIIEKAPEMDAIQKATENESKDEEVLKTDAMLSATGEKEFILVGSDNEPGLTRQVEPVYGDARYVRLTGNSQFYDVLPRRRFTVRRGGRELAQPEEMHAKTDGEKTEQQIPVQIVNEPELPASMSESAKIAASASPDSATPAMDAVLSDPKPVIVPESNKQSMDAVMTT